MSNNPRLSICISTLNRAQLLKELIQSILNENSNEIEIVISDGGSDDNTSQIMNSFVSSNQNIKFIDPGRSVGLDEGYHLAVKASSGDYIWCMPDDDYILPDAISKIIRSISKDDKIDFLIVNLRCYTNDLKIDLNQNLIPIKNDKTMSFEEFKNIFAENIYGISYMGTIILKKEIWFENNPEDFYDSWFGTFAAMGESKLINKVRYISEPIIYYRSACSCWTEHSFEIWYKIWPNLVNQFGLFSKKINKNPVILYPWLRGFTLLKSRAMGEFNFSCYLNYIKDHQKATLRVHLNSILISLLPIWGLNFLVLITMLVFKRNHLYSIYTMAMSSPNSKFSLKVSQLFGLNFHH
jgi:abequosyltransferase